MHDRVDPTLAQQAGVEPGYVGRLVELGILQAQPDGGFTVGDVRRVRVVEGLERGGLPLAVIGEAVQRGALSFDFVDQPSYDRFGAFTDTTFRQVADQRGIPLELVLVVREAFGFPQPGPDDRLRETELHVLPFLEVALEAGIRPMHLERTLRVAGDGLRRLAETEAAWWRTEILEPLFRAGIPAEEIGQRTERFAADIGDVTDEALVAIYHGQQGHAWMRNIFEGFEGLLTRAGMHAGLERPPAICFFDLTGYSRLTEERGDEAAAELAGRMARLVQRASTEHGGTAIKWLGDGVMFHFREPGEGVIAALEMLDSVAQEGLPPAHVGLHAGPVLFQEGDYFGRTVNGAARIADRARQGQVLVSQEVVGASDLPGVEFRLIGPVELKGLLEPLILYQATRRAPPVS
ncbi:MAG TPA: adenylate cyclase regulatory domain-containing protein [Candidatus Limnocylindrales bacterium]|nr:adenylate cyclase regulatory domain-containing protein [Candidatus Limnocylindrales bacterium]